MNDALPAPNGAQPIPTEAKAQAARDANRALMDRYDQQKKCLQRFVIRLIESGVENGLSSSEVVILREGLEVLGWLPRDVKV